VALYYELPVYRDVYQLILKIFQYTHEFAREYKYTLGQDLKRDCLVLMRSIYRANKNRDKRPHLEAFLDQFELVKLEVRLSVDLRLLSLKKQGELAALMESISKQITGWRNAAS
jgi:hypothetical protein